LQRLSLPARQSSRLSGPYKHDNLSIYLVHGQDRVQTKYLTLTEALEQHKVVVYETGSVNQLQIENLSKEDVYIQSGESVKGGRQDRVLKVSATQAQLAKNLQTQVKSTVSESSYQLSLEAPRVKHTADDFKKDLAELAFPRWPTCAPPCIASYPSIVRHPTPTGIQGSL
jgi:hypothetical protein